MKRPPPHLRCPVCKRYADARTRGVVKIDGKRIHVACILPPQTNTPPRRRRLTAAECHEIFGYTPLD